MPDKSEKDRGKEFLQAVRETQRRKVRDSLLVLVPVLKALFDYVEGQLQSAECDNTLRYARDFIRNNGLPEEAVIGWLEETGGYCDCETLMNSEQVWKKQCPATALSSHLQNPRDWLT